MNEQAPPPNGFQMEWQDDSGKPVEAFAIVPLGSPPNTLAELVKRERELWQAYQNAQYDVRHASRDGGIVYDAVKVTESEAVSAWHEAYNAAKDAVRDIPSALGITADNLKRFL